MEVASGHLLRLVLSSQQTVCFLNVGEEKKKILLYKGGTKGDSNTGNEPYSEYYAFQVAQALGINAIEYGILKCEGEFCSTCEFFTSKDYASSDDLENEKTLLYYTETLVPCVYDDFIGTAKAILTPKHREGLRKMLEFKFKKNPRYNLPDKRLKLLEKMIQERARVFLENNI